ncbi:MAG: hypothetical protein P1U82_20935 [Verrucomicrobiales bacterium]|nr:hypothetical protein [Verrucomicrobiales bacterium]
MRTAEIEDLAAILRMNPAAFGLGDGNRRIARLGGPALHGVASLSGGNVH